MPRLARVVRRGAAAEADEHARGARAHEVQRRGVGRGAADDHGHVELVDELLEVERLDLLADVLGADGGAADDEQVDAGVDDGLVVLLGALRAEGAGDRDTGGADLGEALLDELGLDRLGVELLHAAGRVAVVQAADLARAPARGRRSASRGPRGRARRGRRACRSRSRSSGLTTESIGAASTGMSKVNASIVQRDRDVLRVAGAAARHDRDVVEGVRPAGALGAPDLDVAHPPTLPIRPFHRRSPGCDVGDALAVAVDGDESPSARTPASSRTRARRGGLAMIGIHDAEHTPETWRAADPRGASRARPTSPGRPPVYSCRVYFDLAVELDQRRTSGAE